MSLSKTRGVILRAINIREADRILEIYTDELGKVRAVAKGVRKIQSRLAGHLEPFTYVDLMLAQGRGDLPTITGARALEHYQSIRKDLNRVAVASFLAELVSRLTPDNQASRRFPVLLRESFKMLDAGYDPVNVGSYYEWKMLGAAGWEPQVKQCVACHERLYPQGLGFSLDLGGVLCKNCVHQDREVIQVSPELVKLLRCYADRPFTDIEGLLVSKKVRQETARLTDRTVRHTLEREPRARAFMRHLETV